MGPEYHPSGQGFPQHHGYQRGGDRSDIETTSLALGPRQADGSLPNVDFMKLAAGSQMIDKGTNVGLPYVGAAPDLGAYEYGATGRRCANWRCRGGRRGDGGCRRHGKWRSHGSCRSHGKPAEATGTGGKTGSGAESRGRAGLLRPAAQPRQLVGKSEAAVQPR